MSLSWLRLHGDVRGRTPTDAGRNMLILFDTSTTAGVVALADPDARSMLGERRYERAEGGSSLLLTGVRELLETSDLDVNAVTGIVVNRGPGSYTGLRVGFALAQGLAESRGIPVVAIPSFQAFAAQYLKEGSSLAVCYDARSRGIGWVTYLQGDEDPLCAGSPAAKGAREQAGTETLELGEDRVLLKLAPPAALPGLIPRPCRLVGPGLGAFSSHLEEAPPDDLELVTGSERPAAGQLLRLGASALQIGGEDHAVMTPFYLGTIGAPKGRGKV